ncbi:SDR family oxidoreductase [Stutzerimonas xanthomarina]|uniref:SDR family oxidoreductase n=1 Tax=Stutzerimonas xanthomarina TaxID=271420 RepID=A0A3R8UDE1_9GAMM|nr:MULTISPECIES: SDR family oxidoreductase [Stutzerimonas]MCW8158352.1 SDR family oxidoreductase [Stutzerimonas stutzeri]RRV13489.1 SDR family oxidoreductase [Stutzerimonas xanthomarina]
MDFGIAGKVAFVSGGTKGVGRKVSEMLASEGCKVVVVARGQQAIDETVGAIREKGGSAVGVSADLTKKQSIFQALEAGCQAFGSMPDIAINSVHGPGSGNLMDVTPEQFEQTFQEITLSAVHLAQAVLPHMKEKGWGRFISINSGAAKEPPKDLKHLLANTVRSSVVTLNKSLANEFGPYGITVNTIGTGYIGSERMYDYLAKVAAERGISVEQQLSESCSQIPAGRPGRPEEMAAMIAFLCSDQASYVTGLFIPVDGGIHQSAW